LAGVAGLGGFDDLADLAVWVDFAAWVGLAAPFVGGLVPAFPGALTGTRAAGLPGGFAAPGVTAGPGSALVVDAAAGFPCGGVGADGRPAGRVGGGGEAAVGRGEGAAGAGLPAALAGSVAATAAGREAGGAAGWTGREGGAGGWVGFAAGGVAGAEAAAARWRLDPAGASSISTL
jgi:hypothetical protein